VHRLLLFILTVALAGACAGKQVIVGQASWYGPGFAGRPTASGEPFRPSHRTAAHKTLAFGTVVKVTHPGTGRSVRVVINDRGPYAGKRIIDLSKRAARRIGMLDEGVATVELRIVGCRESYGRCE
jgi:rare lipoprotein A